MTQNADNTGIGKPGKDKGMLEKMAHAVDPPSREISDEEILDPGRNIPREPMDKQDPKAPKGEGRH